MKLYMLFILTSFRVLCVTESWLKYSFSRFQPILLIANDSYKEAEKIILMYAYLWCKPWLANDSFIKTIIYVTRFYISEVCKRP